VGSTLPSRDAGKATRKAPEALPAWPLFVNVADVADHREAKAEGGGGLDTGRERPAFEAPESWPGGPHTDPIVEEEPRPVPRRRR